MRVFLNETPHFTVNMLCNPLCYIYYAEEQRVACRLPAGRQGRQERHGKHRFPQRKGQTILINIVNNYVATQQIDITGIINPAVRSGI